MTLLGYDMSVNEIAEFDDVCVYVVLQINFRVGRNILHRRYKDLQRIVVFPALSNPNISIRTSLEPNRDWKIRLNKMPILLLIFSLQAFSFYRIFLFDNTIDIN